MDLHLYSPTGVWRESTSYFRRPNKYYGSKTQSCIADYTQACHSLLTHIRSPLILTAYVTPTDYPPIIFLIYQVDIFQCITHKNSAQIVYPITATLTTVPWPPIFHFCKILGLPDPWTWKRQVLSNRQESIIMLRPGSWILMLWKRQISHNTLIYA